METTLGIGRDLRRLSSELFDVLVVGGGASGAATAREAALRGFNTALIEREDFSAGASAHCFKVVHGGIRYVQHADVRRLRASCFERAVLLRIAPHLVSPLPFVIPTYGRGKSSRWFLGTGMLLSSVVTRFRDLIFVVGFGTQLWMYATPVVYPLSQVPERWQWLITTRMRLTLSASINFRILRAWAVVR